ncbi:MAG: nuclear transport factor 2 family protein, partial [Solirubrobacterales bacterium]
MSRENVELVRSILEPFAGGNIAAIDWSGEEVREAVGASYADDVELQTLATGVGSGMDSVYRGWDGLIRYLREWLEPFSEYHVEWLDFIDDGDRVLVPSRQWGIGRASGARVELEVTHLYAVRDGQIARLHQFDTLEEAREAAGPAVEAQPDGIATTPRTKLRRKPKRGSHEREVINAILDEALVSHLGVVDDAGHPIVTPTLHARRGSHVYVHGSAANRTLRESGRSQVCLTTTLLDGLVLAR